MAQGRQQRRRELPELAADGRVADQQAPGFVVHRSGLDLIAQAGLQPGQTVAIIDVGAQKFKQPFSPITSEALIATNPEIILVMSKGLESVGGIDGLISLPGISQTPAGKNRAVIAVDDSLLLSFGPRTPDLLRQLSGAIGQVTGR